MRGEVIVVVGLGLATLAACDRQKCGERDDGPVVRLDVALETCNSAPVARIAGPTEIAKGMVVELDANTSSDREGDPLTYAWTLEAQPPTSRATLEESAEARVSWTPDVSGLYRILLDVSDGELNAVPAVRVVDVSNAPPEADAGPDVAAEVGERVTLDASGSEDANGDALVFSWSVVQAPDGSVAGLTDAMRDVASFVPDVRGYYTLRVAVSDGDGGESADEVEVAVSVAVQPVATITSTTTLVRPGDSITLDGTSSTVAAALPLSFDWSIIERPNASSTRIFESQQPIVTLVPDVVGRYTVQLTVDDGLLSHTTTTDIVASITVEGPSVFDPAQVYMLLKPIGGSLDAVVPFGDLDAYAYGFLPFPEAQIRVSDGAVLYVSSDGVRRFVADPVDVPNAGPSIFPEEPEANDPVIVDGAICSSRVFSMVIDPMTEDVFVRCGEDTQYRDSTGLPTYFDCGLQAAIDDAGAVFCDGGLDPDRLILPDGTEIEVQGIPGTNRAALRRRPGGGFWVVRLEMLVPTLYSVSATTGETRREFAYGAPPTDYTPVLTLNQGWIDEQGGFYAPVRDVSDPDEFGIAYFPPDGHPSTMRYLQDPSRFDVALLPTLLGAK